MPVPGELFVVDEPAAGEAPVVVVVHGAMDRASSFGRVARRLADLHVVRYDRRGYGASASLEPGDLTSGVDDLIGVINGRPATVFGHSIGAMIALTAAVRRPDLVRSVLAFEPPTPWSKWWPNRGTPPSGAFDPAEEAEAFMRRAVGNRIWSRLPERTREARRAEGPALMADMASLGGAAPFDASTLTVPVVLAAGRSTTWWHRRAVEELAHELPDVVRADVPGAQHGAHLSHSGEVAELVRLAVGRSAADRNPQ